MVFFMLHAYVKYPVHPHGAQKIPLLQLIIADVTAVMSLVPLSLRFMI